MNNINTKELENIEKFSIDKIKNVNSDYDVNDQIIWHANEICDYENCEITEYYKNNEYGRITRWETWNNCVNLLVKNNIKTCLDIGCANGHFVYLSLNNGIDCYGLEPRKTLVDNYNNKFIKEFNSKKLFVSNYEYFIEFLKNSNSDLKFDCICVINFFHGKGHKKNDLENFFNKIFDHCEYLLISPPNWSEYGLSDLLESNSTIVEYNIEPTKIHNLYKKK